MPDGTEDEMSEQQWRLQHGRHWDLLTRTEEEFDDIDDDYYKEYL
jgi:hypothetical protein